MRTLAQVPFIPLTLQSTRVHEAAISVIEDKCLQLYCFFVTDLA